MDWIYSLAAAQRPIVALSGALVLVTNFVIAQQKAPDRDRDGLSDFHEIHKHYTDPNRADSDGDGIDDGDWLERREFQYTVRTVVQVMRPVTIDYLTDDYQDARVLDETDSYVELEVIHYPFNSVASAIEASSDWRRPRGDLKKWLAPGPTSDWTKGLRKRIHSDLAAADIQLESLDDRTAVTKVAQFLRDRASFEKGFTSFVTAYDDRGRPSVPPRLRGDRNLEDFKAHWARELSALGMYENKVHGSCTSLAIYMSGCLRAARIPTRTVLCIPVVDANDERELAMVERRIQHPGVRAQILSAMDRLKNSWSSHTFNEVFVGGRWHRLNGAKLGQGIYDRQLFGLITHIATFHDWADARFWETVGKRQKGKDQTKDDVFGGPNPYSTISIRDSFGPHCTLECPEQVIQSALVTQLLWTDSKALLKEIRENLDRSNRVGLIALCENLGGYEDFKAFMANVDNQLTLRSKADSVVAQFNKGCLWYRGDDTAFVHVAIDRDTWSALDRRGEFTAEARNQNDGYQWEIPKSNTVNH